MRSQKIKIYKTERWEKTKMFQTCHGFQHFRINIFELQHRLENHLDLRVVQFGPRFKFIQQQQRVCLVGWELSCKSKLKTSPEDQMNAGVILEVLLLHSTCGLQGSPDFPTNLNMLQNLSELLSLERGIKHR